MTFHRTQSRLLAATFLLALTAFAPTFAPMSASADEPAKSEPNGSLKILLITSGCCHDYDFQAKALQMAATKAGVEAQWTVVNDGGKGTEAEIDFYNDEAWAKPFDVVIHNECFAGTTNPEYIQRITKAHRAGTPAVVIHCAMHTYRDAKIDDWREFLGVTSRRHDHQSHYPIKVVAEDHPVMREYPAAHVSAMDELYIIEKVWPNTTVLATSKSERDGKEYPVIWTNQYGDARVYGTTYGHSNETFQDEVFLANVVRGMLWAAGRLE